MEEASNECTLVVDSGSSICKAGYVSEDIPSVSIPTAIGQKRKETANQGEESKTYIGKEAQQNKNGLNFRYPIKDGVITDWDDMELIWKHIFDEVKKSADSPVIVTEPLENPKHNKEKTTEMMFETFGVPSLYLGIQSVLALYASGRTSGIVVDSGFSISNIVPVYDGYCLQHGFQRIKIAGDLLTEYMTKLLIDRRFPFMTSDIANTTKEKFCFCSLNFDEDMTKASKSAELDKQFELPDGRVVSVAKERMLVPELMFSPSLFDINTEGIHKLLLKSLNNCDIVLRDTLSSNIVTTGGNTNFGGFPQRLQKEALALQTGTLELKVEQSTDDGRYSAFRGASTLASLSSFEDLKIRKEEYEDIGCRVVHMKCF